MTTQFHTAYDMDPADSAPEHASECDCCGKMKYDCEDIYVSYVGDTHACAECRDYDGAGKRDYYRQDPDR